jgi:hypothetical protein
MKLCPVQRQCEPGQPPSVDPLRWQALLRTVTEFIPSVVYLAEDPFMQVREN